MQKGKYQPNTKNANKIVSMTTTSFLPKAVLSSFIVTQTVREMIDGCCSTVLFATFCITSINDQTSLTSTLFSTNH